MKFLLAKLDNNDGKKNPNLSGEELAKKEDSRICDIG